MGLDVIRNWLPSSFVSQKGCGGGFFPTVNLTGREAPG